MQLYEFGPTRSLRPRWVLQELGVPFEAVNVNLTKGEHRAPAFLELNPSGKVPVLVDGDLILTESVAISLYLAEKYPHKRLIPEDPSEKADVYRWLLFAATELEQPLWRIAKHTALYPEEKRLPAEIELARADFDDRELARDEKTIEADERGDHEQFADDDGRRVPLRDRCVCEHWQT